MRTYDVVVFGDEIESVLTAVSAVRQAQQLGCELSVALIAPSPAYRGTMPLAPEAPTAAPGWLGGLSTRGGLSYMDITPQWVSGLFQTFLQRCQFKRVALNPDMADAVLRALLNEHQVELLHAPIGPCHIAWEHPKTTGKPDTVMIQNAQQQSLAVKSHYWADTTPDCDYIRALGVPYRVGTGQLFQAPDSNNPGFLGISPVFRIVGLSRQALATLDQTLRSRRDMVDVLKAALPFHPAHLAEEYAVRDPFFPNTDAEDDYLDILNPALGVLFHLWKEQRKVGGSCSALEAARTYAHAPIWIDGGNVSQLADGSLGFNGMVTRCESLEQLVLLSQGNLPIPQTLLAEMRLFEQFLQESAGQRDIQVMPPQQLYVRQTVNVQSRQWFTGQQLLAGGVKPEESLGVFSYWLDFRGVNGWEHFPEACPLPKPEFRLSLQACLLKDVRYGNMAMVSRSAGYTPVAQSACRIVQHLCQLGEAVGIAVALAAQAQSPLTAVPVSDIQQALQQRQIPYTGSSPGQSLEAEPRYAGLLQADVQEQL